MEFTGTEAQKHEQRLNQLAAEGWDYMGLLSAAATSRGAVAGAGTPASAPSGLVAFKRPK